MAARPISDFGFRISDLVLAGLTAIAIVLSVSIAWADGYSERSAEVSSLPAEEKAELLRKKERFDELPEAKRQRIRDLHEQISSSPDAEELQAIMGRYCDWLKNLQSLERDQLLELPADQRIERIKQIVRRQENTRFQEYAENYLPQEDRDAVRKWLEEFVLVNEDEIIKHVHWDLRRKVKDADDRQVRSRLLMVGLFWRPPSSPMPYPKKAEVESLVASLSEATRKELEKAKPSEDRTLRGYEIVRAALGSVASPPPTQEELKKFMAGLPADQKARLEAMDADEMKRELPRMYRFAKYRQGSGGGFRGDGPRGDGPRGPRPGGPPGPPPPGFASPK